MTLTYRSWERICIEISLSVNKSMHFRLNILPQWNCVILLSTLGFLNGFMIHKYKRDSLKLWLRYWPLGFLLVLVNSFKVNLCLIQLAFFQWYDTFCDYLEKRQIQLFLVILRLDFFGFGWGTVLYFRNNVNFSQR